MNTVFACPFCNKEFQIPEDLISALVKCPGCKASLQPSALQAMPQKVKRCPACAEIVQFEAVKCRFCGEHLAPRPPSAQLSGWSMIRIPLLMVIFCGIIGAIYFFLFFDTTVAVPTVNFMGSTVGGGRVNNMGLLQDRQNGIIVCLGLTVIAMFFSLLIPKKR